MNTKKMHQYNPVEAIKQFAIFPPVRFDTYFASTCGKSVRR